MFGTVKVTPEEKAALLAQGITDPSTKEGKLALYTYRRRYGNFIVGHTHRTGGIKGLGTKIVRGTRNAFLGNLNITDDEKRHLLQLGVANLGGKEGNI